MNDSNDEFQALEDIYRQMNEEGKETLLKSAEHMKEETLKDNKKTISTYVDEK